MNKAGKVVIFLFVSLVLVLIAMLLKEVGAGAVLSIAGVAIFILYQAMFKKKDPDEESKDQKDITLRK